MNDAKDNAEDDKMALRAYEESSRKEREAKLPRWARNEIERLRRDLAYAERKLETLFHGPDTEGEATTIIADPYGAKIVIPFDSVEFRLKRQEGHAGRQFSISVSIDSTGNYFKVNGSDAVDIRPQATNSFEVRVRQWKAGV